MLYIVLYRQTAQCVQTEGTLVSWRLLWHSKVEQILSLISQLSTALVLRQNTNGCYLWLLSFFLFPPKYSFGIWHLQHASYQPPRQRLQCPPAAPHCPQLPIQGIVFHPQLLFYQRRTYQLSATHFVFCLYRCLFGLRFQKCLGRCACIVVFNLACCYFSTPEYSSNSKGIVFL